jgi:effector-binding domain-containing protein
MIEAPRILPTTSQPCAMLRLTVPRDQIQHVMGPGLREVFEAIAAQGLNVSGRWFTHHLSGPSDVFDLEIGVPVSAPLTAAGRVTPGEWPAMTVARTVYTGPFEGLAAAWGEFRKWIDSQDVTSSEDLWERYLSGPESSPNPTNWRTELNQPVTMSP